MSSTTLKVAAVQAEPAWFDLQAGVAKVVSLIKEAGTNGAQLIGFPESFIPGYPGCIWTGGFDPEFLVNFQKNCLSVKSEEFATIRRAARDAGIWVVLGYTELDGYSMYGSQSFINPQGQVVLHRRKTKPTGQERTLWGDGPDSLQTVVEGPNGIKIGGLNCWEHLQPLLRFHHYSLGCQIHVACWPYLSYAEEPEAYQQFSAEMQTIATRFTAFEGQTFVICSTQLITPENFEKCRVKGTCWAPQSGGGFAAIYGPDGAKLTPDVDPGKECILYADINLDAIHMAKLSADPVGHYSRPDLLSLNVGSSSSIANPATLIRYPTGGNYKLLSKCPPALEDES
ncbi:carbon-nitrogen hydrolase [Dendrothele bispora CBS 962.96]|uniref:Carbon-nitrogen hydrolase n=1 Tax=Dendrothele bispora (strain CBS 962.96) TaxID=1314807 RepID=A0A4S8L4E1_DENBC|nr:carbon-nitrogen hydrolase [Dendrothele bispora CBS 962.96]